MAGDTMKTASIPPSLWIIVLLAGCDESFTPGELAGTYGLAAIERQPPPYLEVATIECDQHILGGALVLSADATHDLGLSVETDCSRGGGQRTVGDRTYLGTFSVDGDRLEFSSPQPVGPSLVFQGRARGSVVDVALPSTVVGLDPFLDVRFDEGVCPEICIAESR
jgi:hypothetical protein